MVNGVLKNIRILDLSRFISGPYYAQIPTDIGGGSLPNREGWIRQENTDVTGRLQGFSRTRAANSWEKKHFKEEEEENDDR
jgi:hypothetical protein